jgi:hypothetical protein
MATTQPRGRLLELFSNRWLTVSWLGLLLLLVLAPRLALDSGLTFDEELHRQYGDLILAWYRSGFSDRRALEYWNMFLYGGLFDLIAQWIVSTGVSAWGVYETRHVCTALVATAGVVATWKAAARLGGARAGFAAALMLVLTPCWIGHGLFNPKDIPFGAAAAFVAYTSVAIALRPAPLHWSDALRAAIALGLALAVRPGGMFLGAFPVFAAFGRVAIDAIERRQLNAALTRQVAIVVARLSCVLPISWALMLSAWPWAQLAPFTRPFKAASIAAHFTWRGTVLFEGKMILARRLPLSYLPVWFAVTLPETYLIAALCALGCLVAAIRSRSLDRPSALALCCLMAFVVVPYAGVVIARPTIYDAQRHFLFVVPPMAAIAGVALSAFATHPALPRALRVAGLGLWAGMAALVVLDMSRIHPYEYTYFNRSYGGLPAASERFETDYWGASYREGFAWVVDHIRPSSSEPVRVVACRHSPGKWQINYLREQWNVADKYVVVKHEEEAEIYLGFTRGDCGQREGEILHTVERQGVPLLYVIRLASAH